MTNTNRLTVRMARKDLYSRGNVFHENYVISNCYIKEPLLRRNTSYSRFSRAVPPFLLHGHFNEATPETVLVGNYIF